MDDRYTSSAKLWWKCININSMYIIIIHIYKLWYLSSKPQITITLLTRNQQKSERWINDWTQTCQITEKNSQKVEF